jgi:Zn finger protein HypA/HybF involved in hydrogenase expression
MSKYCQKCGKEIPQNSKEDSCENCQNNKNGIIMGVLKGVGGLVVTVGTIVLFVVTRGKFGGPKT